MANVIHHTFFISTGIYNSQISTINNRMLSAGICNLMAIQIDSYIFILCNCKWRCQCHIFRQLDHAITIWCWQFAAVRKRSNRK